MNKLMGFSVEKQKLYKMKCISKMETIIEI